MVETESTIFTVLVRERTSHSGLLRLGMNLPKLAKLYLENIQKRYKQLICVSFHKNCQSSYQNHLGLAVHSHFHLFPSFKGAEYALFAIRDRQVRGEQYFLLWCV